VIQDGEEGAETKMMVGRTAKARTASGSPGVPRAAEDERGAVGGVAEQEVMTAETLCRMNWPVFHLMTRKAKTICRPRPQTTVRQRMARRSVERA
jgi:hypothetical protein